MFLFHVLARGRFLVVRDGAKGIQFHYDHTEFERYLIAIEQELELTESPAQIVVRADCCIHSPGRPFFGTLFGRYCFGNALL